MKCFLVILLHLLKVFGCACYALLKSYTKHKLDQKTTYHIFLSYPHNFKGYICYNQSTKQTIVSRHVIFHDTIFSFVQTTTSSSSQTQSLSDPSLLLTLLNLLHPTSSHSISIQSPTSNPSTTDITYSPFMDTNAYCQSLHVSSIVDTWNNIEVVTTNAQAPIPHNTHVMQTRAKSGTFKPKSFHITTALPTPTSIIHWNFQVSWMERCNVWGIQCFSSTMVVFSPSPSIHEYCWL